jgi:hypothetical protein
MYDKEHLLAPPPSFDHSLGIYESAAKTAKCHLATNSLEQQKCRPRVGAVSHRADDSPQLTDSRSGCGQSGWLRRHASAARLIKIGERSREGGTNIRAAG